MISTELKKEPPARKLEISNALQLFEIFCLEERLSTLEKSKESSKLHSLKEALEEEKAAIKPIPTTTSVIDPEDVIAWLITQPNANGTLYLENVVRQYMCALRSAPTKLDIPATMDVRNIFACRTPDDLNAHWEIFKNAPNYRQVNNSTSCMFSAALNCYMRYLQYLMDTAKKSKTIIDQGAGSKIEAIIAKPESQNANTFRRVDFDHPELCAQTKPITCIIKGQEVLLKKKKWSHLLVAITERFIADDNPKLEILKNEPLYGQKSFFLTQKSLSGTCAKLSNGNWIYTNYNPQNIVTIIRNLCHHCDLNSDDVLINYESKDYAPLRVSQECSQPTCVATITPPRQQLDPIVIEQLTDILSSHFSNGYILR